MHKKCNFEDLGETREMQTEFSKKVCNMCICISLVFATQLTGELILVRIMLMNAAPINQNIASRYLHRCLGGSSLLPNLLNFFPSFLLLLQRFLIIVYTRFFNHSRRLHVQSIFVPEVVHFEGICSDLHAYQFLLSFLYYAYTVHKRLLGP